MANNSQFVRPLNNCKISPIIWKAINKLSNYMISDIGDLNQLVTQIAVNDRELRSKAISKLLASGSELVPGLIVPFISSSDARVRNSAGEILQEYGELSLESLIKFLYENKDPDDLKFAVDLLGLIGNSSVEKEILEVFSFSTNDNLTLSCIEALGNIKSKRSVKLMIEWYGKSQLFDPLIIDALGKIGTLEARSFLLSKYQDAEEIVKYSIVECLGDIGEESTFFFLLSEIESTSEILRRAILQSLYKLKNKFELDIPYDERMKNLILDIIDNGTSEEKYSALKILMDFNDKGALLILAGHYGNNPELDYQLAEEIKSNYIEILKNIGHLERNETNNLPELMNLLTSEAINNTGQFDALTAVEQKIIITSLTDLLNNPSEEIRYCTMQLLFYTDPESLLVCSELILDDNNLWNRMKYLELLSRLDSPRSAEIIEKMTNDCEEMIREKAVQSIRTLRSLP